MSDKIVAIVFPFDLFGSSGTSAGAQLLGDALRELIADNRQEKRTTRSQAYQDRLKVRECHFETIDELTDWRKRGRSLIRSALKNGEFVLWLSGNHLGVLPVYEELGVDTTVVQFDAHLDVYNLHDCTEELSHGNFLLHAETKLPSIVQIGHRDLILTNEYRDEHFKQCFSVDEISCDFDGVVKQLEKLRKVERLWIDIDCDVFDPVYFPAVTQRQPFGLMPQQMLRMLNAVWSPKVCGVSISEYEPGRDDQDRSLALLVWLIEWMMLKRCEELR